MRPITIFEKGGIKMCKFKVGDEVYFSPYRTDAYIVKHGKIAKFEQSLDPERKYAVMYCDDGRSVEESLPFQKLGTLIHVCIVEICISRLENMKQGSKSISATPGTG